MPSENTASACRTGKLRNGNSPGDPNLAPCSGAWPIDGVPRDKAPPGQAPDTRKPEVTPPGASRSLNEAKHGTLAPHFRLLELGGGDRPVERGAQLLGRLQGQLDPRPRTGVEVRVVE